MISGGAMFELTDRMVAIGLAVFGLAMFIAAWIVNGETRRMLDEATAYLLQEPHDATCPCEDCMGPNSHSQRQSWGQERQELLMEVRGRLLNHAGMGQKHEVIIADVIDALLKETR